MFFVRRFVYDFESTIVRCSIQGLFVRFLNSLNTVVLSYSFRLGPIVWVGKCSFNLLISSFKKRVNERSNILYYSLLCVFYPFYVNSQILLKTLVYCLSFFEPIISEIPDHSSFALQYVLRDSTKGGKDKSRTILVPRRDEAASREALDDETGNANCIVHSFSSNLSVHFLC